MKSFVKIEAMLRRVQTALDSAPDGDDCQVLAAVRDALRWARHDYIQDYQVTQHIPTHPRDRRG
jgi:hypothetical protein